MSNSTNINFFDYFKTDPLMDDIERYRSLWKAVILQAVTDAISSNKRTEIQLEKKKATAWLFDPNQDFNIVCEYAGYSPAYVRDKARLIIEGKPNELVYDRQYHRESSKVV